MRPIKWMGSTLKDLRKLPSDVREVMFVAIDLAANGHKSDSAFQMQGDLRDVMEIRVNDRAGTYRTMYTTNIGSKVYALHAFQKKSKHGIATPKRDLDLIRKRLKEARADAKAENL